MLQKKTLFILLNALLLSCNNIHKSASDAESDYVETDITEETASYVSDMIDVISVETGWYDERVPQIKIKFKNVSGLPLEKNIQVKYQFVEGDEIIDEGFNYLHTSGKVPWDNGIAKTETYRSASGYLYGGHRHVVHAKVCYDDNSVIWEGDIAQKVIY